MNLLDEELTKKQESSQKLLQMLIELRYYLEEIKQKIESIKNLYGILMSSKTCGNRLNKNILTQKHTESYRKKIVILIYQHLMDLFLVVDTNTFFHS